MGGGLEKWVKKTGITILLISIFLRNYFVFMSVQNKKLHTYTYMGVRECE